MPTVDIPHQKGLPSGRKRNLALRDYPLTHNLLSPGEHFLVNDFEFGQYARLAFSLLDDSNTDRVLMTRLMIPIVIVLPSFVREALIH